MAEFVNKYLRCPCLPWSNNSSRHSARSKVRALVRKRHRINNGGPVSTSAVEESVTITRNGSLTVFSVSGAGVDDSANRKQSLPEALWERMDLPGAIPNAAEEAAAAAAAADARPKYNMSDGTKELTTEDLLRLPQPSKSYVTGVRMRRLMKEFKAVTKIVKEAKREDTEQEKTGNGKGDLDSSNDAGPSSENVPVKDKVEESVQHQDSCSESPKARKERANESGSREHQSKTKEQTDEASKSSSSGDSAEDGGREVKDEKGAKAVMKALSSGGFTSFEKLSGTPYEVELVNDSLAEWNIKLYHINPKSSLAKDMKKHNHTHVLFNMTFPDNFPFAPPFVRVVSPHIEYGYVLDGGAICMELLTPQGWSSAYTIDAVIMQLGATLVAGDGRIVQSGYRSDVPFNKQEAEVSFRAIIETHERYGWHKTPGDNS